MDYIHIYLEEMRTNDYILNNDLNLKPCIERLILFAVYILYKRCRELNPCHPQLPYNDYNNFQTKPVIVNSSYHNF